MYLPFLTLILSSWNNTCEYNVTNRSALLVAGLIILERKLSAVISDASEWIAVICVSVLWTQRSFNRISVINVAIAKLTLARYSVYIIETFALASEVPPIFLLTLPHGSWGNRRGGGGLERSDREKAEKPWGLPGRQLRFCIVPGLQPVNSGTVGFRGATKAKHNQFWISSSDSYRPGWGLKGTGPIH